MKGSDRTVHNGTTPLALLLSKMYPRVLTTPPITMHPFGLLLAAAYVVAFWWLIRGGRREELEVDVLSSLGLAVEDLRRMEPPADRESMVGWKVGPREPFSSCPQTDCR